MVSVNSEEDLFSKLETAIGPGKSKSKESKAFQSLFSQAVISRYDEAKAEARCAAIHSGKFSIEVTGNRSLRIEFWKGIGYVITCFCHLQTAQDEILRFLKSFLS